ncbi:MAG TPA: hypothetical protein VLM38_03625 [Blastocatellia bacterium]|nr:hypothetical protein [Blastocatellia bacterium]
MRFRTAKGLVGSGNDEAVLMVLHEGGVAYVSLSLLMLVLNAIGC